MTSHCSFFVQLLPDILLVTVTLSKDELVLGVSLYFYYDINSYDSVAINYWSFYETWQLNLLSFILDLFFSFLLYVLRRSLKFTVVYSDVNVRNDGHNSVQF